MKSKKVIAIAFSDLHINLWSKFNANNKRTLNHFRVLFYIKKICVRYKVPALFTGDMFHKPESIDNDLLDITIDNFKELSKEPFWNCYFIDGNHDMKDQNYLVAPGTYSSSSFIRSFSKVFNWLRPIADSLTLYGGYRVWGVSYIDHNKSMDKIVSEIIAKFVQFPHDKNILMLHTDYPGAKDTDGSEVATSENLNLNLLNKFDLVIIGHIHKPQRLSKKVYMVGAPLQQRRTDKNCDLGYMKIYSDLSVKYVSLAKKFPKFIDVENSDDIKDDGNYYTVIPKRTLESPKEESNKINKFLSKTKLARKYIREKGVKDKGKTKLLIKILKEEEND